MPDKYLITLGQINGFGGTIIARLYKYFGSYENIWKATATDLEKIHASQQLIDKLTEFRQQTDPDFVLDQLSKNKINALSFFDDAYPYLLKQIKNPPVIIYTRGNFSCLNNQPALSIVGTRHHSPYGQQTLERLLRELASHINLTVSGLAYGIDSIAHVNSIKNNIPTLAVVASGLDWKSFEPRGQTWLAEKIIANNGCLLSDFPIGHIVQKYNFPQRNRLIAGLTKITIVIEAGEKSGALITAQLASDYGREVFALPGDVTRQQSWGCNRLISKGANVLINANSVLSIFNIDKTTKTKSIYNNLSETQQKIIACLQLETILSIDELSQITNLANSQLLIELTDLELNDLVKRDLFGKVQLV